MKIVEQMESLERLFFSDVQFVFVFRGVVCVCDYFDTDSEKKMFMCNVCVWLLPCVLCMHVVNLLTCAIAEWPGSS